MSEASPTFDLQSHSDQSDGAFRPGEVVKLAAKAGVELLSLTDHDSVDGVPEAREAAAEAGLRIVTGVEISALDRSRGDLHILGYLIDEHDRALGTRLETFRHERERRAQAMAGAIRQLGYELDEGILRAAFPGGKINRPAPPRAGCG